MRLFCTPLLLLSRPGAEWPVASIPGTWTPMRVAQGRPLGFLVAWLRLGRTAADKAAHGKHKKECTTPGSVLFSGADAARTSARTWVQAQPSFAALTCKERAQWTGEGAEPEGPFRTS